MSLLSRMTSVSPTQTMSLKRNWKMAATESLLHNMRTTAAMQETTTASLATTAIMKVAEKETKYQSTLDTRPERVAPFQTNTAPTTHTSIQQETREQQ